MDEINDNVVIVTKGDGEFKFFYLINIKNDNLIDMFFDQEEDAIKYAHKKKLKIEAINK